MASRKTPSAGGAARRLETYRRKRDFGRTPEPRGESRRSARSAGGLFVVHKHDARNLHFDLRLEQDGVLRSWAVPKGPSRDPGEKRLAVEVEDHPLDYGDFEGIIPEGEYGGGTVMLWDRGRWHPEGEVTAERIDLVLEGSKLNGRWTLTRMHGGGGEDGRNWLLIKRRATGRGGAGTAHGPAAVPDDVSVATGRTMAQIASDRDRSWGPEGTPGGAAPPDPSSAAGARAAPVPEAIAPQLASPSDAPPAGSAWLHEIKFDGYRIVARLDGGAVRLGTRNDKDWTERFGLLATLLGGLPVASAILDGEVVALEADGTSSFRRLQEALGAGRTEALTYQAFDLLYLDGYDLTGVELRTRKGLLAALLASAGHVGSGRVRFTDHLEGNGPAFLREACSLGLEGVVSKRADAPYRGGRTRSWLKSKCSRQAEFLVGGYTDPAGRAQRVRSAAAGRPRRTGQTDLHGACRHRFRRAVPARDARATAGPGDRHAPLRARPRCRARRALGAPRDGGGRRLHRVDDRRRAAPPRVPRCARRPRARRDPPPEPRGAGGGRGGRGAGGLGTGRLGRAGSGGSEGRGSEAHGSGARGSGADGSGAHGSGSGGSGAGGSGSGRRGGSRAGADVAGVRLTHPDRVLYPEQGVTKLALARYYEEVAEWILPHLAQRPLSLVRCPQGRETTCFYQKHPGEGMASRLPRVGIEEKDGTHPYLYVRSLADLVALVQAGVLELHVWGSRIDDIERPDLLVFDLDPAEDVAWRAVLHAARELRERLDALGLAAFVRTTGGKGLHVVVPLEPRRGWDDVKAFARGVAEAHARAEPRRFTTNMSKAKRGGRIFLDYLRNGRGATAIASYSTRARVGAPVAVPLRWDELGPAIRSDRYHVGNVRRRLAALTGDPWEGFEAARRPLTDAMLREVGAT